MKNILKKTIDKNREVIIALVIATIELLIIKSFFIIGFLTNDDTGIQSTYALGYAHQHFVSIFLGYFLQALYHIMPSVAWWYVWSLICELIGISMLNYSFLKIGNRKRGCYICIGILFLIYFSFCLSFIAFTLVPCLLAIGGISLLFTHRNEKFRIFHFIIPTVSMMIAMMHRDYTGIEMLCFLFLGLIYYFFSISQISISKTLISFFGTFVVIFGLVFIVYGLSELELKQTESADFFKFNINRMYFADYPHQSFDEAKEIYESVGWDDNIYELAIRGCYLPEEVNSDSLEYLVENVSQNRSIIDSLISIIGGLHIKRPKEMLRSVQNYDGLVRLCTGFVVFFAGIFVCVRYRRNKELALEDVCIAFSIMGSTVLALGIWIAGRLILRAYLVIYIPAVAIILMCILVISINDDNRIIGNRLFEFVSLIILVLAINIYGYALTKSRSEYNDEYKAVTEYAKENSDNLYVFSDSSIMGLGKDVELPVNLMYWGGTEWKSKMYYEIIAQFGMDELNFSTLLNNNVYFVSKENDKSLELLCKRYIAEEKNVAIVVSDTINDNFYVYKFVNP